MEFKTDIEIAQSCEMKNIREIAVTAGVDEKYLELYGNYKAKVDYKLLSEDPTPDGKLILVTAISPTPAGEGKTTTSVGLADGLRKIGKKALLALQEFLLALLQEFLLCLHALALCLLFLAFACEFVLLLVQAHLALLVAVLGLLNLLVALVNFFLELGFLAQELFLYFEQFLLLHHFCLLLGGLAGFLVEGCPCTRYKYEVPHRNHHHEKE